LSYYIKNEEKNGIEIYFDEKPDEATRNLLKEEKWRWNPAKKCWYHKYSEKNENLAFFLCAGNEKSHISASTNGDNIEIKKHEIGTSSDSIFTSFPDCVGDRSRLRGVLLDFFLGDKLLVNTILAAFDAGITSDIENAAELNNLFKGQYIKKLENEYGISSINAAKAIGFWLEEYGGKHLGRDVVCSEVTISEEEPKLSANENVNISQNTNSNNVQNTNSPVISPSSNHFDIKSIDKGEKLPKALIIRDIPSEKSFGILNTNISAFKDYTWNDYTGVKIVGEFEGHGSFAGDAMVLIVAHNDFGEPIGMTTSERFSAGDLDGHYSFDEVVPIPHDELISDISVRIALDPADF
jgi:hypothetical protein